jgi:4-hydroxyphenylpyruvate dioxygenase
MSTFEKPTERPEIGVFHGFDHMTFWVGNAMQAASFYCARFGFEYIAYEGLETGNRDFCTHVVKNGQACFAFKSPLTPNGSEEFTKHHSQHGDGVKDVAFTVDNAAGIYEKAVQRGATSVRAPETLKDDHGSVIVATVKTYGDTTHTFVQRVDYTGPFLPGFKAHHKTEPLNKVMPKVPLMLIDHCVGNQPDGEMEAAASWYEKMLDFHRFWSVDENVIHTEYSALRSIVVTDFDENVKMPINEPAPGKRKSQIEEYVEFYGGAGVQHIAIKTDNIIEAVEACKARGLEFLTIPDAYYDNLRKSLAQSAVQVKEDLDILQKLKILIDYDDNGYLLQIFTKPVEDRPTLFIEII